MVASIIVDGQKDVESQESHIELFWFFDAIENRGTGRMLVENMRFL